MKAGHQFLAGLSFLMLCGGLQGQLLDPLDHWQIVATPSGSIRGLAYKGGHFVGFGSRTNIIVSTTGVNWGVIPSGLTSFYGGLAVAEGAGQFVAVGPAGNIFSSPDGLEWTRWRAGPLGSYEEFWAVTHGPGAFVAVGFENPGARRRANHTFLHRASRFSLRR